MGEMGSGRPGLARRSARLPVSGSPAPWTPGSPVLVPPGFLGDQQPVAVVSWKAKKKGGGGGKQRIQILTFSKLMLNKMWNYLSINNKYIF